MRRLSLGVLAMILISTTALAEPDKAKGPGAPGNAPAEAKGHDEKSGAARAMADDDEEEAPAADAGKPVAGRRTPAQMAFRKAVWERNEKALEAKAHKDGKKLTEEEREAIKAHWLRVARLMRIRELAQEDKNEAAVKRVDAALEREEKRSEAKIEKLNAKAPGGAK